MIFIFPIQDSQSATPQIIDPKRGIITAQIICVALILGAVAFMFVTLVLPADPRPPIISWMALGFAILETVLRFLVPSITARARIKKLTATGQKIDGYLFSIFQTKMIVGLALLEGACFFNLVAYMTERQWWSLAIVGVLLFLMMTMFPTLGQFESWAEEVKRDLQNQF